MKTSLELIEIEKNIFSWAADNAAQIEREWQKLVALAPTDPRLSGLRDRAAAEAAAAEAAYKAAAARRAEAGAAETEAYYQSAAARYAQAAAGGMLEGEGEKR